MRASQDLDGDDAIKACVAALLDLAHATGPNRERIRRARGAYHRREAYSVERFYLTQRQANTILKVITLTVSRHVALPLAGGNSPYQ